LLADVFVRGLLQVIVHGVKVALVADNQHVPARRTVTFVRYLTVGWRDKRRADWHTDIDAVMHFSALAR
jgi:hypothetical protein